MATTGLEESPNRFFCILSAIGTMVYQTMDNMDGKQARKTGTSSPLGMIFDHGFDSVNSFMQAMTFSRVFFAGNIWSAFIISLSMAGFFMGTFETYAIGGLHLPVLNFPNEGQVAAALMTLISGLFGPRFWVENHILGLELNVFMSIGMGIGGILVIVEK